MTEIVATSPATDPMNAHTGDPIGDTVPAALATYYRALDSGRIDEAVAAFSSDSVYAVPVVGPETQPRVVTVGHDELRKRFEQRGVHDRIHEVHLCVVDGLDCLVEGIVRTRGDGVEPGRPVSTFVASATLSATGTIDRYLAFGCNGARDPIPTDVGVTSIPADVDDVLHAYFGQLDEGHFVEAADCFSADSLYSHPPYKHTGIDSDDRVEFRSRDELLKAFRGRGKQSFGHTIVACIQRGPHAILEGAVIDLPHGGSGSFISSLSLDADGRIRRYVSFYCEPSVPRR